MKFKIFFQNIFIGLVTIVSIIIATYLWEYISFPIPNINELGRGQYIDNNYNQKNELLRYLNFILLPLVTFLILMIYFKKIEIKEFFSKLQFYEKIILPDNNLNFYIKIFLLLFLLFEFLSLDFSFREIDLFHEGDKLTPSFRNHLDGSLWSGSFLVIGLFTDILNTKILWDLFNHESIGLMRLSMLIYIFFCKVFLILIAHKISIISNLKNNYREFFFILLSLFFISLIDYDIDRQHGYKYIIYRELPVLIFAYIFIDYLLDRTKKITLIILLSPLSVFAVMLSLDRGLIFNFILILFMIFLIINNKYKQVFYLGISILICWIFTLLLLENELIHFLQNSLYIITEINYVHGIIHPTPFSDQPGASRGTKIIITILLSLIISFYLFSKKEDFFSINLKIVLLFFSMLAFFGYFYALARTDVIHMRESFGYPLIFMTIFLLFIVIKYLSNIKLMKFIDNKTTITIIYFLLITLTFFSGDIKLNRILDFEKRIAKFIYANDELFLNDNDKEFIKKANKYLKDVDCFQNFTNDLALNYLLRKKNCSKHYIVYSLGSKRTQNELINDLKNIDVVIAYTDKIRNKDWHHLEPNYKLWIVKEYIDNNYNIIFKHGNRIILKR